MDQDKVYGGAKLIQSLHSPQNFKNKFFKAERISFEGDVSEPAKENYCGFDFQNYMRISISKLKMLRDSAPSWF